MSEIDRLTHFLSAVRKQAAQIEKERVELGESCRWTDAALKALGERVYAQGDWRGLDFETAVGACTVRTLIDEWWEKRR
jgi:hypothetical protein